MEKIFASIITIGDELLIGQTIDTNSAFIAQELNKIGIWVRRRVAVGDHYNEIWNALDEERKQSQIIILTGGLGPTADDITKPLLCKYFGGNLIVNKEVLAHVQYLFEHIYRRPGPLLDRNRKQAEVPDVCTVLHNARGTAPGMWFECFNDENNGTFIFLRNIVVSLPGVPHEMKGLLTEEVIPKLQQSFEMPYIAHRTVFTAGIGESYIAEKLADFEKNLPENISLAYLPNYGMVRLRLTAFGKNKTQVEELLQPLHLALQEQMKDYLVANEDNTLQEIVGKILTEKNKTLATAESCTGGYIAHLITSVSGSSAYFKGSVIAYGNEAKQNLLGVPLLTLQTDGAVSESSVTAMANGALMRLNADYVIAASGIMGPNGGTAAKPLGTVWIAVGNKDKIETLALQLRYDRARNIEIAANTALNFLQKFILNN